MNAPEDPGTDVLRRIAEAATPEPWGDAAWEDAEEFWFGAGFWVAGRFVAGGAAGDTQARADAEHVAAFDPPTVLALLDRIDQLVAALNESTGARNNPKET